MNINPLKFELGSDCNVTEIFDTSDYENFNSNERYIGMQVSFKAKDGEVINDGYSCRSDKAIDNLFDSIENSFF